MFKLNIFKSVVFRYAVVALITLCFMVWAYRILTSSQHKETLPFYGPLNADSSIHLISDFSFIDQQGRPVLQRDYDGKIYVADFIFTTCEGICPKMTNQMKRVYDRFKGDDRLKFLSHTVKPEEDSVSVLAEYALSQGADPSQWKFVTGDKKQIYEMARKSYMLSISEGNGGADDFVHTQYFALIDPHKHIRGFYDGTDSTEVNKLIADIGMLMEE